MHMHVDKPRHDKTALRIDHAVAFFLDTLLGSGHNPVLHQHIQCLIRSGGRIDYASIFDQYGHLFFLHCMSSSYHIRLQFSIQFQRHIRLHIDPLRAVILL